LANSTNFKEKMSANSDLKKPNDSNGSKNEAKSTVTTNNRAETPLADTAATISAAATATSAANSVLGNHSGTNSTVTCSDCHQSGHEAKFCATYKTQICPHFLGKGCRYKKEDCRYAHGSEDQRIPPNSSTNSVASIASPSHRSGNAVVHTISLRGNKPMEQQSLSTNEPNSNKITIQSAAAEAVSQSKSHSNSKRNKKPTQQCSFVHKGECKAALMGKECEYRHGFCRYESITN
jgi:hypothetical protein